MGEIVEVWSNSSQAWIRGARIVHAPTIDCKLEGFDVKAGTVKVVFDGNTKWIFPEMVAEHVRRPLPQPPPPPPPPPAASPRQIGRLRGRASADSAKPQPSALLCKFGCGRSVQPGLTKGMKPFDTCCKRCALNPGKGDHDPNCGSTSPTARRGSTSSEGELACVDARKWLRELTESEEALKNYAAAVFFETTGGQKYMKLDQFKISLRDSLLRPVEETLPSSDDSLKGVYDKHASWWGSGVDVASFQKVCRNILHDYYNNHFPTVLPLKTRDFVRRNVNGLSDVYDMGEKLGEGSFGIVSMVTHKISREKRVCKRIEKLRGAAGMPLDEILREIGNMAVLDHPNVIKVYEYFEDETSVSQIMEPCNGGELQDRIDDRFKRRCSDYAEDFICDVMKQTLRALAFLHGERFLHKDLKPQNIMMVDKTSSSIKLIDFGIAELFEPDRKVSQTFGGTLLYIAPEGFGRGLEMKSDIWSAGVILYNLITGDFPFMEKWPPPPGRDINWWQNGVKKAIVTESHRHHPNLSNSVSQDCVDLMRAMLNKDPRSRPDAAECLMHDWFKRFDRKPPPLSVGVIQCLDAFAGQPELKKAVFLLMAHQCSVPALQELRAIFTHFDTQNRGTIDAASIREVLSRSGMPHLRGARILHALDRDQTGYVSWTEFIAAALCISVCQNEPLVAAAFAALDHDGDGKTSRQDVADVLAKGQHVALWSQHLPAECDKISRARLFTKEQFQQYVGAHMRDFIAGDAIKAVS